MKHADAVIPSQLVPQPAGRRYTSGRSTESRSVNADTLKFFDPSDPDTGFLCNFFRSPFLLEDRLYPTVEHAYQASKFSDAAYAETVRQAETPRAAKTLGRAIDVPLKPDWEQQKQAVMLHWVAAKLCLGEAGLKLPQRLLATGKRRLVEDSPTDVYWGIGSEGKGANHLGHILMAVREVLLACDHENMQNEPMADSYSLHRRVATAALALLNDPEWDPCHQPPGMHLHVLRGPLYGQGFKDVREALRSWLGVPLAACWGADSEHNPQLLLQAKSPQDVPNGFEHGLNLNRQAHRRFDHLVLSTVGTCAADADWADEDNLGDCSRPSWKNLLPPGGIWSLEAVSVVKSPKNDEAYNPMQYFQPSPLAICLEFHPRSAEGTLQVNGPMRIACLYAEHGSGLIPHVHAGKDVGRDMVPMPYGRPWELLLCSPVFGGLPLIEAAFAQHFSHEGIELPPELVTRREACAGVDDGMDGMSCWQIDVAFGVDEAGEFMDMDSEHRMSGPEYLRFYADGQIGKRESPIPMERFSR